MSCYPLLANLQLFDWGIGPMPQPFCAIVTKHPSSPSIGIFVDWVYKRPLYIFISYILCIQNLCILKPYDGNHQGGLVVKATGFFRTWHHWTTQNPSATLKSRFPPHTTRCTVFKPATSGEKESTWGRLPKKECQQKTKQIDSDRHTYIYIYMLQYSICQKKTWNLKINPLKRKIIFHVSPFFGFHINFLECPYLELKWPCFDCKRPFVGDFNLQTKDFNGFQE